MTGLTANLRFHGVCFKRALQVKTFVRALIFLLAVWCSEAKAVAREQEHRRSKG